VREGSALLAALLIATGIAYWSDHYRALGPRLPVPPSETPPAPPPVDMPQPAPVTESLEVSKSLDPKAHQALCEELLEVVRDAEAALQTPRAQATIEQLNARRRLYQAKRADLGC
jgi:hypothetical protein